jgi:hypothetical protein
MPRGPKGEKRRADVIGETSHPASTPLLLEHESRFKSRTLRLDHNEGSSRTRPYPPVEGTAFRFDEIVESYDLSVLRADGDFSITDDGDLALTRDGNPVVGDVAYNGLFRLVETWRYNAGHLRYLFDTVARMNDWCVALDERINAISPASDQQFPEFAESLRAISEDQGVAEFGSATYSGCLMIVISGAVLRLKDDLGATASEWKITEPLFNSHSVGSIVVASANGFPACRRMGKNTASDRTAARITGCPERSVGKLSLC